jgi:hypothetical protein
VYSATASPQSPEVSPVNEPTALSSLTKTKATANASDFALVWELASIEASVPVSNLGSSQNEAVRAFLNVYIRAILQTDPPIVTVMLPDSVPAASFQ